MRFKSAIAVLASVCCTILTSPSFADWVPSSQGIPKDAIVGGIDQNGNPLYICRGYEGSSAQPGYRPANTSACHIGYGSSERILTTFDSWTPAWRYATASSLPQGALFLGYQPQPNDVLYPCQANDNGSLVPGKFALTFSGCYIPYGGQEVHATPFNVLVDEFGSKNWDPNYLINGGFSWAGPYAVLPAALNNIPIDAIIGGYEANGQPLYLCTADYGNNINPGKTRPGFYGCDVSYGGTENYIPYYRVLVPNWVNVSGSDYTRPASSNCDHQTKPITTGNDGDGTPLYICRVAYGAALIPGKLRAGGSSCDIGFNGQELFPSAYYQLLTDGFQ